ncbi:MAG TPA: helix-turn-helix transcriptional regulator [Nitrospirales bacterium]|jgi:transcriptional regulator with XRE-family HTH domain
MSIGPNIQAWRLSQRHSVTALAHKAGLSENTLESIESGELDLTVSVMQVLAAALGIPVSWLSVDPRHVQLLTDPDQDGLDAGRANSADPVIECVLRAAHADLEMYALLTAILQSGEPKLMRAAEASLRSLAKQAKQPTVPWQSRPSGHFEPPSD